MKNLIIAEHDHRVLHPATLSAAAAAAQVGGTLEMVVVGHQVAAIAEQASRVENVSKVIVCDAAHYQHFLAEDCAPLFATLAAHYTHLWFPASAFGKDIAPRTAALLGVGQVSGITAVESPEVFVRVCYAGNIVEKVRTTAAIKVITVAQTAFTPLALSADNVAVIESIVPLAPQNMCRFVSAQMAKAERPDLTTAEIVVSGGRGVGSVEKFALIEELADVLGAAVGASRAAVDAGFVGNESQVGQTGKSVAPKLYIAVGISGAIQHLAGMKDAKTIVTINKDAEAPLMAVADYALIGDLFTVVPELIAALRK